MQNLMPPIDTPDNLFIDGNPTTGIEGTIVTAEWLNNDQSAVRDAQQEMINVLAGADILPDPEKNNQLLTAIQAIVKKAIDAAAAEIVPDIGELYFTTDTTDPNVKYAGTTWAYLGEGVTLRTAKADGSDLNSIVGADNVTLTAENMPPHAHSIAGQTGSSSDIGAGTSAFDYGSKSTDVSGDHVHRFPGYRDGEAGYDTDSYNNGDHSTAYGYTESSGPHAHNVAIGAHDHYVTLPAHSHTLPAATEQSGAGSAISLLQKSINVAIWVRIA